MTEFPERKVLKDLLTNLKSKTLTSSDALKKVEQTLAEPLQTHRNQVLEGINVDKRYMENPALLNLAHTLVRFMDLIEIRIKEYLNLVHSNYEETALYIEALEKYSTELDNTLTSIFEQARKQAEEQIKQQEAISKRNSSTSYTA